MRRHSMLGLAVLGVYFCISGLVWAGTYSGGDGTAGNPYQISRAADWKEFMATADDWGNYFILTENINLAGIPLEPVGNVEHVFNGVFDGNGFTIYNAVIYQPNKDYVGLFGIIGGNRAISNIGVDNITVTGHNCVGGLAGLAQGCSVTSCYVTGSINGCYLIGGLIGLSCSVSVSDCCTRAIVNGNSSVGGLVGGDEDSAIVCCFSAGPVIGYTDSGGLIGWSWKAFYETTACFWDIEISGTDAGVGNFDPDPAGVMGKSTAEMKIESTFIEAGWDFTEDDGDAAEWKITNYDYPCLSWNHYGGGSGTRINPYQIWSAEQMNDIGINPNDWDKHFKLMVDIDLSLYTGTQYHIIGNSNIRFSGSFDGNGHVIHNLSYITDTAVDYVGLFGYIFEATIQNLGIENANLRTGGSCVGAVVGHQEAGNITNCYSAGVIASYSTSNSVFAGGIAGYQDSGTIKNCYSTCKVNASSWYFSYAGGIVGHQTFGTIMNCYSTAIVLTSGPGDEIKGGLVGSGSSVINSFWDIQSGGLDYSGGGNGRTTAQLKQKDNYIGWNTPTQISWIINENMDYPRLNWENKPGIPLPAQAFSDLVPGEGTESDPYRISTPEQLNSIGLFPNVWDKVFCLEKDIDISLFTGTEFNRIGTAEYPLCFSGIFDGKGHVIRNLTYTTRGAIRHVGLFGNNYNATIMNLGVENINISVRGKYVGGLVGSFNNGVITNCYSTGSIAVNSFHYPVYYPTSTVDVSTYAGGLVGYENYGTITNCYSKSSVTSISVNLSDSSYSYSYAGGMVGYLLQGNIEKCYSAGFVFIEASSVYYAYSCAGGLVGRQKYGVIMDCYSTSTVSSCSPDSSYAGGLVGAQWSEYKVVSKIINCYSVGKIAAFGEQAQKGGLIGYRPLAGVGVVTGCFWDMETSGQMTSAGGVGKSTAEMKMRLTFASAGWDFWGVAQSEMDYIWSMESHINEGYPYLASKQSLGTPENPYQISMPEELIILGDNVYLWDKCFILVNDIDMSSFNEMYYNPIGNEFTPFSGNFDGRGYKISNLNYISTDFGFDMSLFGCTSDATIKNLGIENINILSDYCYAGGLVGCQSSGIIMDCYTTGSITALVGGGLVGYQISGTITRCYSTSSVTSFYAGGLVGEQYKGAISNCYSNGPVTMYSADGVPSFAAGLVGLSEGTITYCYSTGSIVGNGDQNYIGGLVGHGGAVNNSFWDIQVSGITNSAGGTGLQSEQMTQKESFVEWDFISIWTICDGTNYPRLRWQVPVGDWACPDGVGVEDLEALGMAWLTAEGQAGYRVACDANSDGRIDMADFEVLAGRWMEN